MLDTMTVTSAATLHRRRASLYRYYVLGILSIVGVFSWMDRQLFSILLESIKHDLRLTDTQLGLLGGIAFGLFYAAVGLPVAKLADRLNRRNLVVAAVALWSCMTALCGLSTGFGSLFLARMGVGIGEAGSSPASQSMVSDYFPPRMRGLAMGLLYTYVPIGYVLAYATGGFINDTVGWRAAFLMFGIPGLLLAAWTLITVREPRRGQSELAAPAAPDRTNLLTTLRTFIGTPSLRHIPVAGALHGLGAFGAAVWVPAYFMRTHSMSSFQIGSRLALLMGTAGLAGAVLGGFFCDKLISRTRDPRWYMWVPAASLALAVPFLLLAFTTARPDVALLFYAVPLLCNHIVLGPLLASMQSLAGIERRASIAGFYLFFVNLIAMGLGPFVVGLFSDLFHARLGDSALRYSLMTLTAVTCAWASLHLLLASRTIASDLQRSRDPGVAS